MAGPPAIALCFCEFRRGERERACSRSEILFLSICISWLLEEEGALGIATNCNQCFMRCSVFLSIDHRADWMPYGSSLHNLIASLRISSSHDRQNDQRGAINGWPFNFFFKVEVITVKQSIQKIEESSTIEIFVDRPAWLPHLGKQP